MMHLRWEQQYRSRNYYQAFRKYLNLPHQKTVKSYFGTLDASGSGTDFRNTTTTVLIKLTEKEK